ncbi:MAG: type I methionyl aminopeptidase [Myxococcota bacterium]
MSRRNLLSPEELPRMRASCQLAARTLEMVADHIRPGITTDDLDRLVDTFIRDHGAYPSPLDYGGFPKSVCTSINEVVCHGIPSNRTLQDGDIINVDVTCTLPEKRGYFGDTSATFYVGEPRPVAMHITEVAREALEIGIATVRPGRTFGDVGHAIQTFVESKGCSVVRDFTGHGIGRQFHTAPSVPHYGEPGSGPRIKRGMTFTIEPMVNLGSWETVVLDDGWTAVTKDGSLSAQFEHTLLATKNGVEVLTRRRVRLANSEDRPYVKLGPLSVAPSALRDAS